MWLINTLLLLKMESLLADSRIQKMAACGVKVGNIKLFWKHCTKSAHKQCHIHGICAYKLRKEHSGDDFIPKVWRTFM